jgi:hypothetical protein
MAVSFVATAAPGTTAQIHPIFRRSTEAEAGLNNRIRMQLHADALML